MGAGAATPAPSASAGALSPPLGSMGPGVAAPLLVGPGPPLQPSPPSYPAVLKDRPPSFSKGHAVTAGAPGSAKIPPPVPPRGSSPHSRRGSFRFGQQPSLRRSLRSPPPTVGVCSSSSNSSSNGGGGGRRPLGTNPRSVTFTLDSPPPSYEYLASTESSFSACDSLTYSSSSATLAESKVLRLKSLGSSSTSTRMVEPAVLTTFLSKRFFSSIDPDDLEDTTHISTVTDRMEVDYEATLGCLPQPEILSVSNPPMHPEASGIQFLPPELALSLPKPFASRSPALSSVIPPVYVNSSAHSVENVNYLKGDSIYIQQDSLVSPTNSASATADGNASKKQCPCTQQEYEAEDLV